MAGLEPISFEEENEEVWCIVKGVDYKNGIIEEVNVFDQQMEVLGEHLP